jgi:predicted nucleic acid-binding protein
VIAPPSWPAPLPVIFDTNVLLSGIFFGGVPGRLLTAWQESRMQLVLSPDILAEYYEAAALTSQRTECPQRTHAMHRRTVQKALF